jgi:hypothetical protein
MPSRFFGGLYAASVNGLQVRSASQRITCMCAPGTDLEGGYPTVREGGREGGWEGVMEGGWLSYSTVREGGKGRRRTGLGIP